MFARSIIGSSQAGASAGDGSAGGGGGTDGIGVDRTVAIAGTNFIVAHCTVFSSFYPVLLSHRIYCFQFTT